TAVSSRPPAPLCGLSGRAVRYDNNVPHKTTAPALPKALRPRITSKPIKAAVGPDNRGLADPIVHSVTGMGANIAEIQMFDHDEEAVFSMLTRVELEPAKYDDLRGEMVDVARRTGLSIRTWTPDIVGRRPRLAICVTYRPEPALALLRAIRDGQVKADVRLMIGNRESCRGLAEQFGLPWFNIARGTAGPASSGTQGDGAPDDERMIA